MDGGRKIQMRSYTKKLADYNQIRCSYNRHYIELSCNLGNSKIMISPTDHNEVNIKGTMIPALGTVRYWNGRYSPANLPPHILPQLQSYLMLVNRYKLAMKGVSIQ